MGTNVTAVQYNILKVDVTSLRPIVKTEFNKPVKTGVTLGDAMKTSKG